jgi:hypothetical protein
MPNILSCTCCGSGIEDSSAQNVDFGKQPNPHDEGYGLCHDCGGDNRAPLPTTTDGSKKRKKKIRKRLGWATSTFFEARFDTVRSALSLENQTKWDRCSYEKKIAVIAQFVEKGLII